jgi:hypothetical protein
MNNFLIANLLHFCRNYEHVLEKFDRKYKFVTFLSFVSAIFNENISTK